MKVVLRMKDACCRSKLSVGINQNEAGLSVFWPHSLVGDTTRF